MARIGLPQLAVRDLCRYLGSEAPAENVSRSALIQTGFLPPGFDWDPDICLLHEQQAYLIHSVVSPEIPKWVTKPVRRLKGKFRRSKLIILVRIPDTGPVWKVAGDLAEQCRRIGAGLAVELPDGACLAFPPGLAKPKRHRSRLESGHI